MISYSDLKAYSSNCVNITEFRCHMHMKEKRRIVCENLMCLCVEICEMLNLQKKVEKLL